MKIEKAGTCDARSRGSPCVGSFFYSYSAKEKSEMPNKTFFTYEQQIEKLTKEKQLVISDP